MENYLITAIVTLGTGIVALFGLLVKAYQAVGAQKDLRLKDRHKAEADAKAARDKSEEDMEALRDKHGSDLEDIKKLILGKAYDEPSQ